MMFLLDTNILLEVLIGQERAEEVKRFLRIAPKGQLFLSDFSLYSVGIQWVTPAEALERLKRGEVR